MNTLKNLSSQGKDFLKNLGYATTIALLFVSCGEDDKKENNKFDSSLPIAKGNLIGHGGKGSRNLPVYNREGKLIDYNAGDTMQVIYDQGKIELLDMHNGEQNGYQYSQRHSSYGINESGQTYDYAQPIYDMIVTQKIVQYEPVNTTLKK